MATPYRHPQLVRLGYVWRDYGANWDNGGLGVGGVVGTRTTRRDTKRSVGGSRWWQVGAKLANWETAKLKF